ncbi:AF4/FMR2 family member 4 isoform X12 [Drosophila miranda]|uniref:AF4/FMR2 family member 4 isoform X12 n=1 Tax=Drosophila miranda TaxID=7229 RepID=UPI0007E6480D|nr:AF4/FMR2 family member 4 isoform X12 [Drosophila miranda]
MEKPMHHAPAPAAVGKVSQIANIFQRKPIEIQPVEQLTAVAAAHAAASAGGGAPSHSARFNNARALFEKLGVESNSNVSSRLLRSGSREDNLCDGSDRSSSRSSDRSQSPPKRRTPFPSGVSLIHNNNNASVAAQNGSPEQRLSNSKFIVEPSSQTPPTSVVKYPQHNLSRLKTSGGEEVTPIPTTGGSVSALFASSGADKPEKPERKFNSRELIEKQKKWTSHFTKTKTTRTHSDLNRCDIIRTVPGTGLIMDSGEKATAKPAMEPPNASPNPPMRHAPNQTPPEIKPRSGKIGSPVKSPPLPPIPAVKPKNVSPVKFNPDRVRSSPTKSAVEPSPPPPPAKSAAVTAAMQRSLLQEQQQQNTQAAPIPPEKPRKKSIDLIEDQTPNLSTNCSTSSSCTSPTSSASNSAYIMQAAKRGSLDAAATGHGNGLSGSTNSAASCSPVASASSGPSSPVHTEDEKQENESTEKSELMEHYHNNNYNSVPRRRRSENEGRKSVDESTAASQQQQHSSNIGSSSSSPQRVANKRSSIILQMPAAGLGQRPPSIISTASNQDEGELKAKGLQGESLEEQQQHHSLHYVDVGYRLNPDGSETREVYGSETELYDTAKVTDMQRKFHGANGFAQETSTVYAIIKTDLQEGTPAAPPRGLLQSPSADGSPLHRVAYNSPPVGVVSPIRRRNNQEHSGGGGSAKSTPPISPARTALVKGIAPIASIDAHDEEEELDLDDDDDEEEEEEDEHLTVEYVEVREMHKQQQQQQEEEEAPVLPERRAPTQGGGISLEMQEDLEYADTSAGEDEEDILNHLGMIPGNDSLDSVELMDDVVDEVIKVHVNHSVATAIPPSLMGGSSAAPAAPAAPAAAASSVAPVAPAAAIPREDSLPDDMTAAEAERLLSSSILESKIRQQSLLSDEQAKEVEQILNAAAPSVGVTVAAVVATATSPTSIKNLIEEPLQSVANGEQQQDIQIAAVPAIVEEEEPPYEQEEEELQPRYGDEEEEPYEVYDADADADANGDGEEDSDDVEAVDIVGYGQASAALNATFIKADSTETETTTTTPSTTTTATAATASTTANTRHDNDDEPEWLRDVLEAPKRSLENLLITSVGTAASAAAAAVGREREREAADLENGYKHSDLNHTYVTSGGESLHESIVSVDSTQSDATLNQTTTIDDSIISSKHNSTYSLDQAEPVTNSTVLSTGITELDDSQYYIPEYPPVRSKEVLVEAGVHYFEDGNFWMEVPGLLDFDDDDCSYPPITVRKNPKVRFSSGPIHVYSTFSVNDYDRRNEDVDPVAASAEYELEKRVEKMHVFPVELMKGPEGLGLSIIGMGVGADAGLEKLGIFVKTITDNGAAARDGRIQVNDQIIEVDGKSLVGVTQAYAASVLRNTSGLVKFQIGRERDPENSEVAQLIRLSLQADREKEERLKRQQEEYLRRTLDYSEDSTQPVSANSSVCEGPSSPVQVEHPMEVEATHSQEVESLKRLLQESEMGCLVKEEIIQNLKRKLVKLETTGNENELLSERLRQSERELGNIRKEAANLQNMLQQSQGQYMALDKKYNKAKRLVREYQQRELDTCHREEFYQQLMRENDNEYNALVKKLKDRVINLEHELQETQRKAGFPVGLPYDSATLKLTPQMMRKAPPKPLFHKLETELSDTEISDLSPDGDGVKTATVERKVPVKDELDAAVPQHELLDNSVNKTKIDLVKQVVPQSLSPPGTVPWQQQHHQQQQQQQQLQLQQQQSLQHLPQSAHATGPPSPTSMSSGCSSPGYSPSRTLDLSGSSSSFSDRKVAAAGYNYKGGPVHEWTKDQVGHWLMGIELERYIPVFKEHNVEGGALLTLDSKDFKTLGVCGDDKHRLKKRLKDLKANIEKERKDMERERREREKAIRKAEKKLAKKK